MGVHTPLSISRHCSSISFGYQCESCGLHIGPTLVPFNPHVCSIEVCFISSSSPEIEFVSFAKSFTTLRHRCHSRWMLHTWMFVSCVLRFQATWFSNWFCWIYVWLYTCPGYFFAYFGVMLGCLYTIKSYYCRWACSCYLQHQENMLCLVH